MEHALERLGAADLAGRRARLGHAVEHLEVVAVRALVLVDRHWRARLAAGLTRYPRAGVIRRLLLVCALALVAAAPAWAHAIVLGSDPPQRRRCWRRSPKAVDVEFDDPVRVGTRNAAIRNEGGQLGARRASRSCGSRARSSIPLQPNLARRELHRALEHRLRRRPQRGGRDRVRDRRRAAARRRPRSARAGP